MKALQSTSRGRFSGQVSFSSDPKTKFGDTYVHASITNLSSDHWKPSGQHPTHVSYHVLDENWRITQWEGCRSPLPPSGIAPNQTVCVPVRIDHLPVGRHRICLTMVTEGVTWHDRHPEFSLQVKLFNFPPQGDQPSTARQQGAGALTAVFCINEAFLPLMLSLCRHLRDQKTPCVLIIESSINPHWIADLFTSIGCDILSYRSCDVLSPTLRISKIISHAFGSVDTTNRLISRFGADLLEVYADSFLNTLAISGTLECSAFIIPPSKAYFWDFIPPSISTQLKSLQNNVPPCPHEIVSVYEFSHFWNSYARQAFLFRPDLEKEPASYSVLYLRYLRSGMYSDLPLDKVLSALEITLRKMVDEQSTIVIKFDERAGAFNQQAFDYLSLSGLKVISCGDYLKSMGYPEEYALLKAEILFSLDFLCRANAHFVLDSTQGYAVALHPQVKRPTKLFYGLIGLPDPNETGWVHQYMDHRIRSQLSMVSNLVKGAWTVPEERNHYPFCLTLGRHDT